MVNRKRRRQETRCGEISPPPISREARGEEDGILRDGESDEEARRRGERDEVDLVRLECRDSRGSRLVRKRIEKVLCLDGVQDPEGVGTLLEPPRRLDSTRLD